MKTNDNPIENPLSLSARLQHLTLTGIDASVPSDALYEITRRFSFVEFGVLYSTTQNGQGRYPKFEWIDHLVDTLQKTPGPRMALHVCGSAVGNLIAGTGHVSSIAHSFQRVQLNFPAARYPVDALRNLFKRLPDTTFITQSRYPNDTAHLYLELADLPNHAVLFDASCAKGITPSTWPAPLDISMAVSGFKAQAPMCGYAGGLGHENLAAHLQSIASVTGKAKFWLDMESSLRINDAFDLRTALKCLDTVALVLSNAGKNEVAIKKDCQSKACWKESCPAKPPALCETLDVGA